MSEVLYTSEVSGQLWNVCVWDPHTGTSLCTYKDGSSGPRTLGLVGNDYLVSAVHSKTLIHVWLLQKREQIHKRICAPGRVSALAISPDGLYCVAAVQEVIHIWQISTGHLLAVLDKHYQCVTCIRFSDDGSHFVSAGADNLVLIWSFSSVINTSLDTSRRSEPRHVISDHSLPVTDVHIGHGGIKSRVFTASQDHTCKVYELCTGKQLLNLVFESAVTSLIVDSTESRLFAGAGNGNIYQVNLYASPMRTEQHVSEASQSGALVFKAHTKAVTCLALSLDTCTLVSGSQDASVRLWHVSSRQCTRTLAHKGPVTNVITSHIRPALDHQTAKILPPFQTFKRYLRGTQESEDRDGIDSGAVPCLLNAMAHIEEDGDDPGDDVMSFVKRLTKEQPITGRSSKKDDVKKSSEDGTKTTPSGDPEKLPFSQNKALDDVMRMRTGKLPS